MNLPGINFDTKKAQVTPTTITENNTNMTYLTFGMEKA